MAYRTFKQIREELWEGSPFAEKVLMYFAMQEGAIEVSSIEHDNITSYLFGSLMDRQQTGELPGILNPNRPQS